MARLQSLPAVSNFFEFWILNFFEFFKLLGGLLKQGGHFYTPLVETFDIWYDYFYYRTMYYKPFYLLTLFSV